MRALAGLLPAVVAMLGCQLTPNFITGYEIETGLLRERPVTGSLAVRRFREERPARYYSSPHRLWMTYIPVIPYVSLPYERLDESIQITSEAIAAGGRGYTRGATQPIAPPFEEYVYLESFPRAIAADLAAAGLFESVLYAGDHDVSAHRYVLDGVLRGTRLDWSATSFGLGAAGVLLWLLPVPMSKWSASVELDLTLTDQSIGEPVWEHTLEAEIDRLITLYTSSSMLYGRGGPFAFQIVPPPEDAGVDRRSLFGWNFAALRRAMLGARGDLSAALAERD